MNISQLITDKLTRVTDTTSEAEYIHLSGGSKVNTILFGFLVLYVCFVNHSLYLCSFSFDHCIVCCLHHSFWLPIWYLQSFPIILHPSWPGRRISWCICYKYFYVCTFRKSNREIVEIVKINRPSIQIHDHNLSWLGTYTSINMTAKLVVWA